MYNETLQKMYSAIFYLLAFFLSCVFSAAAEKEYEKRDKKILFIILSMISISIPCFVAGFRNISVGTDTKNYFEVFNSVKNEIDFRESYRFWGIGDGFSLAFLMLIKIISNIFHSYSIFLFIIELFIVIPIYIVAFKNRHIAPIWTYLMVFYFLFFNSSLNIMRQIAAASIMLLAFFYVLEKKYCKFLFCCVIACFFHRTFFIGLMAIIFALLTIQFRNKSTRMIFSFSVMIVLFAIIGIAPIILEMLLDWGILSGRGTGLLKIIFSRNDDYINTPFKGLNTSAYIVIIFRFIFVVMATILVRKDKYIKNNTLYITISLIMMLDAIAYASVSLLYNTYYIQRITLYIDYYFILFLPYMQFCKRFKNYVFVKPNKIYLSEIILFSVLLIYWAFAYIYHGYDYTNLYFINTL